MDLLEDLRTLILYFNFIIFIMIHITHIFLVLINSNLNYLKDNIFECSFKKYNKLLIFKNN